MLDSTNYEKTYESICKFISTSSSPGYITVNNVHTVVEGVLNPDFGHIINDGFMALPDGKPLSIVARWKGDENMERVFGPTLLEKILNWSKNSEIRHYFFGSTENTLELMETVIKTNYPSIKTCGFTSPPFSNLTTEKNLEYISQMNKAEADIIWVALGAPKQEKWMAENIKYLNKGVLIGIGAGFDYLAGQTKHAPEWMKNYSLEWLYRLIQEPKRLWKRYCITIPIFIGLNILEFTKLKKFN
jgi:N-acetylglucosaminyldiphosphoundecaprenol N-acetyl-beta-D-mannosaminyltransferase